MFEFNETPIQFLLKKIWDLQIDVLEEDVLFKRPLLGFEMVLAKTLVHSG